MDKLEFRKLRADEIEVRVQSITAKGAVLLLYKDARSDMRVLDEVVGPLNWTRRHTRDNANCIVSIYDDAKKQWIDKEDTGSESNTEAQKGLASDSFKRACFNWGIGRELYTAPFTYVQASKIKYVEGKLKTFDKFHVEMITYDGENIDGLSNKNQRNKRVFVQKPTATAVAK